MKNNEIKNPKVEVQEGLKMNDCDYLTAVLELEKNMSNNYSIALNEASNDNLYEDYFTLFEDTKDAAREIYNLMFQNGWYTIETAEDNKINQKITCFEQQLTQVEDEIEFDDDDSSEYDIEEDDDDETEEDD